MHWGSVEGMARNYAKGFPTGLLVQLLAGRNPKTTLDSAGLIGDLKKALADRMLSTKIRLGTNGMVGPPGFEPGTKGL